ncbi:MAG: Flp pilus assembly complex ATPase component TadA [Anaerovibrio sp.]|uniref:type IV pilus twitching motility protein PilT n=1 Tax=Anaerovibrio sp. TaxID=1872532 RepID=UPI0025FA9198|nr:ATPase, T2SS/T4P/T4SS family [Anaerovibrio sp.]MCR5177036.1 Flp pilus assembly complex ATPase component TadA [Anaerovibrio sp.]
MGFGEGEFKDFLCHAADREISDIFISEDTPVFYRRKGMLLQLNGTVPDSDDIWSIFADMTDQAAQENFLCNKEADLPWSLQDKRFRVHIYHKLGKTAFAIRVLSEKIPSLDSLGQAGAVKQFMNYTEGLLLITGATGAGKTTTVAAMLAEYNRMVAYHILTLEEPVEYLYPKGKCLFSQQEAGRDFLDYRQGIISAMRENPDIIVIAELRDEGACEAALSAAASGHYVIATMHTGGAVETVERLVSMFSATRQNLVRSMLAASLRGICTQRLFRGRGGQQYCGAEILHSNNAVKNIIRCGKYEQLLSVMQSGAGQGMQTMAMAVDLLQKDGLLIQ